jgi:hypothetical protein
MKKAIVMLLITVSVGLGMIYARLAPENSSNLASGSVQIRRVIRFPRHRRVWNNRNNSSVRYETRIVYKGRKTYSDTYRITWKNGREHLKRVSRVRIN